MVAIQNITPEVNQSFKEAMEKATEEMLSLYGGPVSEISRTEKSKEWCELVLRNFSHPEYVDWKYQESSGSQTRHYLHYNGLNFDAEKFEGTSGCFPDFSLKYKGQRWNEVKHFCARNSDDPMFWLLISIICFHSFGLIYSVWKLLTSTQ